MTIITVCHLFAPIVGPLIGIINILILILILMVVGFTTTCAISAYHH